MASPTPVPKKTQPTFPKETAVLAASTAAGWVAGRIIAIVAKAAYQRFKDR